jgi:hypothetical protein
MVQGTPKHRRQPSLHSSQMDVSSREEIEDQKLSSLSVSRGRYDAFVVPCWSELTTDNQQQASLFSQTLPTQRKYANQSRRNSDSAIRAEVTATVPQFTHSLYPGTFSDVSESSFKSDNMTQGTTDRERMQCDFELERYRHKLRAVMDEHAALHRDEERCSSYRCQQADTVALDIPKCRLHTVIPNHEEGWKCGPSTSPSLQESMKFEFRGETLMENDFAPQSSNLDLSKIDQRQGDPWEVARCSMWSKKEDCTLVDESISQGHYSKPTSNPFCAVLAAELLWSELKDQPLIEHDESTADDESVMSSVDKSVFDDTRR